MKKDIKLLNKEVMHDGFFNLNRYQLQHTLFAGGWSDVVSRELFERGDAVAVLLYDPNADKVVIIEQFRIGAAVSQPDRAWMLEIVAGIIEKGETPEAVVHREAQEEAGCTIQTLEFISRFYVSPGGTSERIALYYGQIDAHNIGGVHGLVAEHEDIFVSTVSADEAYQMVQDGRIESAIPIIAIQWLMLNKTRLTA